MEPTPRPDTPIPQLVVELRDLIVAYLKQETLVPLAQLRRYVLFGVAGSLLLGVGILFLAMAALRALQTETGDTFTGNWDWAPYGIVVVGLLIGGAMALKLAAGRKRRNA